ncbi:MAG: hypothetical protein H6706_02485 [Myxococcales bacterium]|nr:hypothetical protein [Myxococcales bacterium]
MDRLTLAWLAFGLYMAVTAGLAWMGHKRTDSLESFAVGRRDMGPWLVGITMAAAMSSTATFIINPGFVYTHGIAAFLHFGVAIGLGIAVALWVLSLGFRKAGVQDGALSLPHWIGARFGSSGLRVFFGALSLLSITFVVLIVGGVQIMLQQTLDLSANAALALTILFVFSYILVGGTYAHTYTNTLQGLLMVGVALIILVKTAAVLIEPSFWTDLQARFPQLLALVNPAPVPVEAAPPALFGDVFSVYVAGVVIGFAVVCQPHLLTKALYLKRDEDVKKYVGVTLLVTAIFFSLLLAGLAAHATFTPGEVPQDRIMATWLASQFGDASFVLISVALVAAGMSTLDGILVAMSTIAGSDLVLPLVERRWLAGRPAEARARFGWRAGQVTLVLMGAAAWLICLHPPKLLGLFGQLGVYGLFAGAVGPVVLAIARPRDARRFRRVAQATALTGAGGHFALYLGGLHPNPGVTATWAILAAALVGVLGSLWVVRAGAPAAAAANPAP